MDFNTLVVPKAGLARVSADTLMLVLVGAEPKDHAAALEAPLAEALSAALDDGELQAKSGQAVMLHRVVGVKARRLVLAIAADSSAKAWRKALSAGLALVKGGGTSKLVVAAVGEIAAQPAAQTLVAAVSEATYLYRHTKPSAPPASKLASVSLIVAKADEAVAKAGLARGIAIASGVDLARELANLPGNHCTPSTLAAAAQQIGKEHGVKVQVLERKDCEKLGMGSFLAVAQGSAEPCKFIVAEYHGAAKKQPPIVLVGKGITFDTGGISLKPGAEMDEMKFDMGGAASVLGALKAVAAAKARVNLVVLVPATENMPGGKAVKPGDVVTSMSGQTIEILNTDAEGRLILCDALTYAERYEPKVVVDVATLTGACLVALGRVRSGLWGNNEEILKLLEESGELALDPVWRMPLDEEYATSLQSSFADVANVGSRLGGAIHGALFLSRFAKFPWAHLDICGSAWNPAPNKGATGRPVPLLFHYVCSQADSANASAVAVAGDAKRR
jgi:leucyl aminopeptidase